MADNNRLIIAEDHDGYDAISYFKGTARALYAHLGLDADNYNKIAKKSRYKDSGHWGSYRNDNGNKMLYVDVGCSCEHDCCGHVCQLSYEITRMGSSWIILTSIRYNF